MLSLSKGGTHIHALLAWVLTGASEIREHSAEESHMLSLKIILARNVLAYLQNIILIV